MPPGFAGLDPVPVRALVDALRVAADGSRRAVEQLAAVASEFDFRAAVVAPSSELAEAAERYERAAVDLEARARLAEAIDAGDWDAVDALAGRIVGTERAWEQVTAGGPDEGPSTTWTKTTWDDLEARMLGLVRPVSSALCAEDAWYRETGTVLGPDGQAYPIVVPNVRNPEAREDSDVFVFNDDWGRSGDAGVTTLLGGDAGWTTVAVETGAGRLGDDPGLAALALIGLSGVAGARHLDARGLRPVPLRGYDDVGFDEWWVPDQAGYVDGNGVDPADVVDVPDELAGVTPVPVVSPRGHTRYESTVPASARGVLASGASELVNQVAIGTANARTVQDRRNIGYAVEYQVNADGRTRAIARGYQLGVDDRGELHVAMGHLGVGADGPGPVAATAPRVHDGYAPTFNTNGIAPG